MGGQSPRVARGREGVGEMLLKMEEQEEVKNKEKKKKMVVEELEAIVHTFKTTSQLQKSPKLLCIKATIHCIKRSVFDLDKP